MHIRKISSHFVTAVRCPLPINFRPHPSPFPHSNHILEHFKQTRKPTSNQTNLPTLLLKSHFYSKCSLKGFSGRAGAASQATEQTPANTPTVPSTPSKTKAVRARRQPP